MDNTSNSNNNSQEICQALSQIKCQLKSIWWWTTLNYQDHYRLLLQACQCPSKWLCNSNKTKPKTFHPILLTTTLEDTSWYPQLFPTTLTIKAKSESSSMNSLRRLLEMTRHQRSLACSLTCPVKRSEDTFRTSWSSKPRLPKPTPSCKTLEQTIK